MEAKTDEPKQDTEDAPASTSSAPANVDVETKLEAMIVSKNEQAPSETAPVDDAVKKKPTKKKKKKTKQASPNAAKKPKKDPNKPEYPKVGE